MAEDVAAEATQPQNPTTSRGHNTRSDKKTARSTRRTQHDGSTGFLAFIERAGNKLPDPFWLFVVLAGLVLLSSWLGSHLGMSAINPSTGERVEVTNLLTGEGIQRMLSEAVDNFITFPPLGVILIVMLGIGVAEHAGLIGASMRGAIARVHPRWLTFVIALVAVTGSIASDAVYVILIPIAAAAFKAVGRSPIVGAVVAFAASSGGFNASLLLNTTDVLLAGISTSAAQFVDETAEVSALANYFFVIPSAIVLAIIVTLVTEFFVDKHATTLIDHDEVDHDAASFTKPEALQRASEESTAQDEHGRGGSTNRKAGDESRESDALALHPQEIRGLKATGIAALVFLAGFFALLFAPGSPLQGPGGAVMESPLITAIAAVIGIFFFVTGLVYGLAAGTIQTWADIPAFMVRGLESLLPMMVLFFAVSQFLAYFEWSNLGVWTAIKGSELLTTVSLPHPALFALFVLLVACINLFITSGSAQWALMAPVIVPMFMLVGITPEVTQMLYRIGDSPANIITPMSPYFALALTFLQRYYRKAGVGTLMSLALPYTVAMLVGWFLFFLVWYAAGLPLGPGVSVR